MDKKSADSEVPVRLCNYTDVYYRPEILPDQEFMRATASTEQVAAFRLRAGDVIITKDSETAEDIGVPAFVRATASDLVCGYHLAIVRPESEELDGRFLYWFMSSTTAREQLAVAATGVTRFGLRAESIGAVSVPYWSFTRQRAIANYLDAETARIDALITKKQRLIEANRVRLAVIRHHLVTAAAESGPRQDAGWLGTVPEHWVVPSLRRVAELHMGTTFPHEFQGRDAGDLPVVKVGDLGRVHASGVLHSSANWIEEPTAAFLKARIVPAKSVLYARVGAAMLLNPRAMNPWPCMLDDNVRGLQFYGALPEFGLEVLRLLDLGELSNPGPVPSIGEEQVMSVPFPLPSVREQEEIVGALRRHALREARLRSSIERQLSLLVEHRQAMITAAVTGELEMPEVS